MMDNKKVNYIIKAARQFSKRAIDPGGKGKAVKRLEDRGSVKPEKLEQMFEKAKLLMSEVFEPPTTETMQIVKPGKVVGTTTDLYNITANIGSDVSALEAKITILENMLNAHQAEIKALRDVLENYLDSSLENYLAEHVELDETLGEGSKVLGFTIECKKDKKWYARKTHKGKMNWVYVGDHPGRAEYKIRKWADKHGLRELLNDKKTVVQK